MEKFTAVIDPRLQLNEDHFTVIKGNNASRVLTISSTSQDSSNIAFSKELDNTKYYARNWPVTIYGKLEFTGTSAGTLLNLAGDDAFRFSPLNNAIIATTLLDINSQSISIQPSRHMEMMARFSPKEDLDRSSFGLSYQDCSQRYEDLNGSVRSPLSPYLDSESDKERRGAFNQLTDVTVVSNGATSAVITFKITENIWISPLSQSKFNAPGLTGIKNLNLTLNLNSGSNLTRLWSHSTSGGSVITSMTCTFGQPAGLPNAQLKLFEIGPPLNFPVSSLAKKIYPYSEIFDQNKDAGTVLAGAAGEEVVFSSISLQTIPERLFIYVRDSDSTRSYNKTDSYAKITNINLVWGSSTTSLSSMTTEDLYKISKKNGLRMSFIEFSKFAGSVVCLIPGIDFVLADPYESPGQVSSTNVELKISFVNPSSMTKSYTAYIVYDKAGSFVLENGSLTKNTSYVTKQITESLPIDPYRSFKLDDKMIGGSIIDDVEDVMNILKPYAKKKLGNVLDGMLGGKVIEKDEMQSRIFKYNK